MARTNGAQMQALKSTTNADAYRRFLRPTRSSRSSTEAIQWMIERKLMEISMNRFTWEGMEEVGVNVRWMEMALNFTALAVFQPAKAKVHFSDGSSEDVGLGKFEALRAGAGTGLTRTGEPTSFWLYGMDGSNEMVRATDCVPIWSNFMRIPDWDIIDIYARRIAEMDTTIEINAENARQMKILRTTQNTSKSIGNINRQLSSGARAIEVDSTSIDPMDAISVLDFEVKPDHIMNMHILRTREWSECMTLMGINNANQDKKERLTAAETAGNDDVIATIRETNLKARRIAAKQINEKYFAGEEKIKVDYTTDMKTAVLKGAGDDATNTGEDVQKVGA
jgi:hypothetical protein